MLGAPATTLTAIIRGQRLRERQPTAAFSTAPCGKTKSI
jgi:hypothetical protein